MTDPAIPTPETVRDMPVTTVKALRKALTASGLRVVQGGAHLRVETADGAFVGSMPSTTGDPQTLRNTRAWLARRVGEMRANAKPGTAEQASNGG